MKNTLLLLAIIIAVSGCGESNRPETIGTRITGTSETADTLCFVRYAGSRNQDTAFVKLIIDGDKVSGNFSNIPYEKDSRIGTIRGVKFGNLVKGTWYYQQEGINDSIAYEFKLENDRLLQKETSYDLSTGQETLQDTAGFSVEFLKQDCQKVN